MLVRVGALYHDIGKMVHPTSFTENQMNLINTLDELAPKESAKIIIDHVIKGMKLHERISFRIASSTSSGPTTEPIWCIIFIKRKGTQWRSQ